MLADTCEHVGSTRKHGVRVEVHSYVHIFIALVDEGGLASTRFKKNDWNVVSCLPLAFMQMKLGWSCLILAQEMRPVKHSAMSDIPTG